MLSEIDKMVARLGAYIAALEQGLRDAAKEAEEQKAKYGLLDTRLDSALMQRDEAIARLAALQEAVDANGHA